MSDAEVQKWNELLTAAARSVTRDFPNVEMDDVHQELWVWLLAMTTLPDPDRQGVMTILTRRAFDISKGIRSEQLHFTAQYAYRPSDVRGILETAFKYNDWENGFVPKDAQSETGLGSMDAVDVRADVIWGMKQLGKSFRDAILLRYRDQDDTSWHPLERRQLSRGVHRLTELMNAFHQHRRPRHAINNATAQYIIENQENN